MKILLLSIFGLASISAFGQNVNIPNGVVKSNLADHGYGITGADIGIIDLNSDGEIQVSEATAYTGKIHMTNNATMIDDYTGIEAFTSASGFRSQNANVTTIDLSANLAMTEIIVSGNSTLQSIQLPNTNSLSTLTLLSNSLTNVNLSGVPMLTDLFVRSGDVTLDLSNQTSLQVLDCSEGQLTSLILPNTSSLQEIDCSDNSLNSLDISQNTGVIYLLCHKNQIASLDVSHMSSLENFYCHENNLSTLVMDNSNNQNITYFFAHMNPNLTCIQVDDAAWSTNNWTDIDATASFSEDCSGGIGVEEELLSQLSISPNPASSNINIQSEIAVQNVSIRNTLGQIVLETTDQKIDISTYPNGVYLITISTEKGIITKRFIKE